jgi:hypothetical protein
VVAEVAERSKQRSIQSIKKEDAQLCSILHSFTDDYVLTTYDDTDMLNQINFIFQPDAYHTKLTDSKHTKVLNNCSPRQQMYSTFKKNIIEYLLGKVIQPS